MTHYLTLWNDVPETVRCAICIMHECDPDITKTDFGDIRKFADEKRYELSQIYNHNEKSGYSDIREEIECYRARISTIDEILHAFVKNSACKKRHQVCKAADIGLYIVSDHFTYKILFYKFTIAEILVECIDHDDSFLHTISDYQIVRIWDFNVEFLEDLREKGLEISENNAYHLMKVAIYSGNLDIIDYLIKAGIDITRKYEITNYAHLAANVNEQLLNHVLERGAYPCVEALCQAFRAGFKIETLLKYYDLELLTISEKRNLAYELFSDKCSLELLREFEKAGFIINDDIFRSSYDGYPYACGICDQRKLEYLISLGISCEHFKASYVIASTRFDIEIINLLESAGIFKFYRPASFLELSSSCEHLIRLLDQGVDAIVDQYWIRSAFFNALLINPERVPLLESLMDFAHESLTIDFVCYVEQVQGLFSDETIKIFDYLLEQGAMLTISTVFYAAEKHTLQLPHLLDKKPDFDINAEIFMKTENVRLQESYWIHGNKASLLEVVIFMGIIDGFEFIIDDLLKRGIKVNQDKLIESFRRSIDVVPKHTFDDLLARIKYLCNLGYIEKAFYNEYVDAYCVL